VQVLNSTRCCESSLLRLTQATGCQVDSLPQSRLHHGREGVSAKRMSQKTCLHIACLAISRFTWHLNRGKKEMM